VTKLEQDTSISKRKELAIVFAAALMERGAVPATEEDIYAGIDAMLAALREPDEAMVHAAVLVRSHGGSPKELFEAMIDAIEGEGEWKERDAEERNG